MYYIAYGSNLNKEEMKQRCKDAKFVSLARLENYTLTYRGNPGRAYLTVDKKKGDFVRVAVWDVSENDKKSLDEYEDYPYLYDCFDEKVLLENNETITGFKRGEIRKQAKTLISSRLWTAGKQVTSE